MKFVSVAAFFSLSVAAFFCAYAANAETLHANGKAGALERPDFSKIAPHPRLFLTEDAKNKILELSKTDQIVRASHESAINRARAFLDVPALGRRDIGRRMMSGRDAVEVFMFLGYAWRTTGDKAFAEAAKKNALAMASLKDWNPSHFLDTSTAAFAMAIAYDWFFDAFDADTKAAIASAIKDKAFAPFLGHKQWWYEGGKNNWSQVCASGLLCAALSTYETSPEANGKIAEAMLEGIDRGMRNCYSPKGMYLEGYGYWNYGTAFMIFFAEALKSSFGNDLGFFAAYPQFAESAKWAIQTVGPDEYFFNFSDAGAKIDETPRMFYFAKLLNDTSMLYRWRKIRKDAPLNAKDSPALSALIFAPEYLSAKAEPPKEIVRFETDSSVPVLLARTGWNAEALFLGVKGGRAKSSHAHMDGGSFVFDAIGARWAFDLGAQNYNSLEKLGMQIWNFNQDSDRWRVFRYNNFSHNILTVNGGLVNVDGFAKITKIFGDPSKLGARVDVSALYSPALKRAEREIAIIDGLRLSVRDTIENGAKKSSVRWNVCTLDTAKIIDPHNIEITAGKGKKVVIKLLFPENFAAKILPADSGNSWDEKNPKRALAGFEGEVGASQRCEIAVDIIPQK